MAENLRAALAERCIFCPGSSPSVIFIVVYWPDVDVDSNNDGAIDPNNTAGGTDDKMEYVAYPPGGPDPVGKIISLNDNDDNDDGLPDYLDPGPFVDEYGQPMPDNDLVKVNLTVHIPNDSQPHNMELDWGGLRVWDSPTKDNLYEADPQQPAIDVDYDNWWHLSTEPVPPSVWIEGITAGHYILTFTLDGVRSDRARVAVVEVDLDIFNGQDARYSVSEAVEEGAAGDIGHGAFTVANLNDTDGDGSIDSLEDLVQPFSANIIAGGTAGTDEVTVDDASGFSVGDTVIFSPVGYEVFSIAGFSSTNANRILLNGALVNSYVGGTVGHPGRDELDLMRLIVHRPTVVMPNTNVKLTVASGNVALWKSAVKGAANAVPLTAGVAEINVDSIPAGGLELWVEALAQSTTLRDIEITLEYMGASDTVNATAVWSLLTDIKDDNGDVVWADANDPKFAFNSQGGFGLRPVFPNGAFLNIVGMQFTVEPQGIAAEPNVFFDISRQIRKKTWDLRNGSWTVSVDTAYPIEPEYANDDTSNDDESDQPTAAHHMYVDDTPGIIPGLINDVVVSRSNFLEFMRVTFENGRPLGDGIIGSKASPSFMWNARHRLEKDPNGIWHRSTGDNMETSENGISDGHIVISSGNQP